MGIDGAQILLDNPTQVYFPGQVVTGKFQFTITEKAASSEVIQVECKGSAHARVDTGDDPHHSNEKYFSFTKSVHPPNQKLVVGRHEYDFSFVLPNAIPSSYEGVDGHVRYVIKATIVRTWKPNFQSQRRFTVNTIVDLNLLADAKSPVRATKSKTVMDWMFCSGEITATAWIDRMGYVPGEIIYFNGKVQNHTRKPVRGSKVQLIEWVTYHAGGSKMHKERVLTQKVHGKFRETDTWHNEPFEIPPVVPFTLPNCKIIDVYYKIRFVIDPRKLSFKLVVPLDLMIGNIPLRSFSEEIEAAIADRGNDDNWELTIDDYPDLAHPPRYEDCVFGGTDMNDPDDTDNGSNVTRFKPRYLTYPSITSS